MAKVYLTIETAYELWGKMIPNKHSMSIPFNSKPEAREFMNRLMNTRERSVVEQGGTVLSRYLAGEDDGYVVYDDMIGVSGLRKNEYHYKIREEL